MLLWSSGKDSAWALYVLRRQPGIQVVELATTIVAQYQQVPYHATSYDLVKKQAELAQIPLFVIQIGQPAHNWDDKVIDQLIIEARRNQIDTMAFGDLFLKNVREYRERKLDHTDFTLLYPLWGVPTRQLSREMIRKGLRSYITCVDTRYLPSSCVGKKYNLSFLDSLPNNVDPCGEYGEFHTLAFAGPMFRGEFGVQMGRIVEKDGLAYADFSLANS